MRPDCHECVVARASSPVAADGAGSSGRGDGVSVAGIPMAAVLRRLAIIAAVATATTPAWAQVADGESQAAVTASPPLPDPLTLEAALQTAVPAHPAVMAATAERDRAGSDLLLAQNSGLWDARIVAEPTLSDRAAQAGHEFIDDSRAGLIVSRRLSDFGRAEALSEAGQAAVAGTETTLRSRQRGQSIVIMNRFFEVLLADMRYTVDDEDMTVRFLEFDRARERAERFEEIAEAEVLELESEYRDAFVRRARSAARQRLSRSRLALAMSRPGELASTLVRPDLSVYEREIPEYESLLADALANAPVMVRAQRELDRARALVDAARAFGNPELRAGMEATAWSRKTGNNRDSYRAVLTLEIPFAGARVRTAEIGRARADVLERQADLLAAEYELRQRLLTLVQELDVLEAERRAAEVEERYRDRYFDRSRSLYQMEVRADLGDSQARQAEALWRSARVEFARASTWAEIDSLIGRPLAVLEPRDTRQEGVASGESVR
jgi:outer membrane protein TolC